MIGAAALAELLQSRFAGTDPSTGRDRGPPEFPHFAPKAKRVIYLFQGGGPSQIDLFDYKPELEKRMGPICLTRSAGQRLTGMTAGQTTSRSRRSIFPFAPWASGPGSVNSLPYTARMVDDVCLIKSLHTEQINHDPAVTFAQTGFQLAGRPSLGAWVAYGLGTMNQDLPAFVVMISPAAAKR